jgi:prophage regulatory protein
MNDQLQGVDVIVRRKDVQVATGYARSTLYARIKEKLWPRPIKLGPRAVGWPAAEVAAMNASRIEGKTDDEIRLLVSRLELDRQRASER